MGSYSFIFNNTVQSFTIDTSLIQGAGDQMSPFLRVPLTFDLTPIKSDRGEEVEYVINFISANLIFHGFNYSTSRVINHCNAEVNNKTKRSIALEFPLTQPIINTIESHRVEDASFSLNLEFNISTYSPIQRRIQGKVIGNTRQPEQISYERFVNDITTVYPQTTIFERINQSHWVKTVLSQLNYGAFRLLEVVSEHKIIPEEYKISLKELEEAKRYFNNHDYDKSVGHCRSALDPFKKEIAKLKTRIPSDTESKWFEATTEATIEWLDKVYKAAQSFTSKPHHPPTMGIYNRHEAESIYLITVGIISYIGRLS